MKRTNNYIASGQDSNKRRIVRCSNCQQEGHNSRTCPEMFLNEEVLEFSENSPLSGSAKGLAIAAMEEDDEIEDEEEIPGEMDVLDMENELDDAEIEPTQNSMENLLWRPQQRI